MNPSPILLLTSSLAILPPRSAQEVPAEPAPWQIEELGLTLSFPPEFADLTEARAEEDDPDVLGDWRARLGDKEVFIDVEAWRKYAGEEPSIITWRVHDHFSDADDDGPVHSFDEHALRAGSYGFVPYVSVLKGSVAEGGTTREIGYVWYTGGIAEKTGWLLTLEIQPAPDEAERALVDRFLTSGLRYQGPERNAQWDEAEVEARWRADSALDDEDQADLEVLRTEHYLVMTNSSSGKKFAEQMELNYALIQQTYPFPEIPARKLMPVFLFKTAQQYHDFYVETFERTQEQARKSKGIASRDFYATYYEAPKDPVHLHESTHQIFRNRLELTGGGSWFQEGVAEYIETRPNERNVIARRVKDGKHTPLRGLMSLESLLRSSEDDVSGDSAASLNYAAAALLVEFLRESDFGKEKFLEWMHATGNVPDNDLAGIEAVLLRVYGVTIDELDLKLQAYCKKR